MAPDAPDPPPSGAAPRAPAEPLVAEAVPAHAPAQDAGERAPAPVDLRAYLGKRVTFRLVQRVVGALGGSLSRGAEDVVSVVLVKAVTTQSPPHSLETADSWLFKICLHAVIDAGRRRDVHEQLDEPRGRRGRGGPERRRRAGRRDLGPLLLPWLGPPLPPGDRDLVEKLKVAAGEGLTRRKDIAARFDLKPRELSDRLYEMKERHLLARHRYLEKHPTVILVAIALALAGVLVAVLYFFWPRAAPPAPRAPSPAVPVLTAPPPGPVVRAGAAARARADAGAGAGEERQARGAVGKTRECPGLQAEHWSHSRRSRPDERTALARLLPPAPPHRR